MQRRKWANYLISFVKYDKQKTLIDEVEVHEDLGYGISYTTDFVTRQTLIENIENKITYITTISDEKGVWKMGQKVELITINGQKFLKTVNDGIEKDNLGELPEF